jgi:hypothetical protein
MVEIPFGFSDSFLFVRNLWQGQQSGSTPFMSLLALPDKFSSRLTNKQENTLFALLIRAASGGKQLKQRRRRERREGTGHRASAAHAAEIATFPKAQIERRFILLTMVVYSQCYGIRSTESIPLRKSKRKRQKYANAKTGKARPGIADGSSHHGPA